MKREDLKALLRGVDGASEIIDAIMSANGADIEAAKRGAGTADEALTKKNAELAKQVADLQDELKAYGKGGAKYIDPAEFQRLGQFETDTIAKQKKDRQTAAVKDLLTKNNAKAEYLNLLLKGVDIDSVEIGEKGEVIGGKELVEGLKAEYQSGFEEGEVGTGGAPFSTSDTLAAGKSDGPRYGFFDVGNK